MSNKEENSVKTKDENKKTSKWIRIVIVVAAILIYSLGFAISLRSSYLNAMQVGENYSLIVTSNLKFETFIAISAFVITYIVFYINNKVCKRGIKKFFDEDHVAMPKIPNKSIALLIAILASIIVPNILTKDFMMFINGTWFGGEPDPIFQTDIGFYMFKLPFIENVLKLAIIYNAILIIYTAIYYVVILNTNLDGVEGESIKKNTLIKQVIFYAFIIVILFSVTILFHSRSMLTQNMVEILDSSGTELTGAGATDATIKLWGYRILSIVIIISVVLIIRAIKKTSFKQGIVATAIVPVYMICFFIAMTYYQTIYVKNNQLDKEKSYIEYNIKNTKEAYGIDIEQNSIDNYEAITQEQIGQNSDVIDNIPLISKDAILKMVQNGQENGVYYSYRDTNLAQYKINGNQELMYITPREILSGFDMSLNNRTYKYTHGYSIVANTANDSDSDGYSEYILSDYSNKLGDIEIKEPRIYFGLHTNSTIAVNTSFGEEFDYPITATNYAKNVYSGQAGSYLGFWDRLILGISNGSAGLAFSKNITSDTKIISNRNILSRANTVLPYIEYDNNPYLVITDEGRMVWVIDGYTVSDKYPYSQVLEFSGINGGTQKINYIRNSVKVLVDSYDGTTKFYITDKTDPIIMVYKNMYPDLFTDSPIPEDISRHFMYPKYLYEVQSQLIALYHDVSSDSLYRADDVWQITPTVVGTKSSTSMEPTYTTYKLPNGKEEFGLVLTYNKKSKPNIIAYLVGTVENGNSKLKLYKFSSEKNIVGISQLNTQIEQDSVISKELEKLTASGVKLTREIKIIPIENTLLYVEPVYQVMINDSEDIPVLKKVIVASGTKVAIGDNFENSLKALFTDYVDIVVSDSNDINSLIDSLIKSDSNLEESMESGNFEMIGKDLSSLRNWIKQLKAAREKELEAEKKSKTVLNTTDNTTNNTIMNSIFVTNTVDTQE